MTRVGSSRDNSDDSRITTNERGQQALASVSHHEHSKLLPWLMLTALLAGIALGVSLQTGVLQNQSENRARAELDKQYRFIQELRIRVEDAEIAAEEVNPKFHPRRTE